MIPTNVRVKFGEIVFRNPECLVCARLQFGRVALGREGIHFELRYKSGVPRLGIGAVPVAGDPPRVLEGENGIEGSAFA